MKLIETSPDSELHYTLLADSSITLPGRPWFLPDIPEAAGWLLKPVLAVRISRLGKSIALRFSQRYFDAVTVAVRLIPIDSAGRELSVTGAIMDFGVSMGKWVNLSDEPKKISVEAAEIELSQLIPIVEETICDLSRIATLKMGDILLIPLGVAPVEASVGTGIAGAIDGTLVLTSRLH